jgi:serine/threonine protein kinase
VHRDIKPVNIGLTLNPLHVSILDLGTVGRLDDTTGLIAPTPGQLGTVHYLAPEMELEDYNEKVDIWASGLVACEIILGHHPWPLSINPWRPDINPKFDYYKARHDQFLRSLQIKPESEQVKSVLFLIADMLKWDPKARPSSQYALTHRCFQQFADHEEMRDSKRQKML